MIATSLILAYLKLKFESLLKTGGLKTGSLLAGGIWSALELSNFVQEEGYASTRRYANPIVIRVALILPTTDLLGLL